MDWAERSVHLVLVSHGKDFRPKALSCVTEYARLVLQQAALGLLAKVLTHWIRTDYIGIRKFAAYVSIKINIINICRQ